MSARDKRIRVVQVGMGPLGRKITGFLLERKRIRLVGAADIDPNLAGKDLGEVAGVGRDLGVRVDDGIEEALDRTKPDVAVLTTVSDLNVIAPQIETIVSRGVHVVSTCEELSYPWVRAPRLARRIDTAAEQNGVAVLGTGVNPGFLMDYLPLTLTAVCRSVRRVEVWRIQNASTRRVPFQKKIGAGLTKQEFRKRVRDGTLRHVGLTESIHMIASALGWKLDRTADVVRPVVASRTVRSRAVTATRGMCRGVLQEGSGYTKGKKVIALHFKAALGEKDPHERILIDGVPRIDMTIKNGVHGDIATCAITVNAVLAIRDAWPGLRTMPDMPALSCMNGTEVRKSLRSSS